ncbi:MAG: hypothetical protein WAX77_03685 [Methylococcaceae bacterium]
MQQTQNNPLLLAQIYLGAIALTIIVYLGLCHYFNEALQQPIVEAERVWVRTGLYIVAIITFPMTNLVRHIQLRLNETMPFDNKDALLVAKQRYLITLIVSLSLIESIAVFGFIMFILGDGFNTLYIFEILAALGLFLYRPKIAEYQKVLAALE